jgi:NAD(P)-dependent dehydrogenase (short-subunit alcohol dehydrogenase family)
MELINKTCLVTGANSGLGLATARGLAAAGAQVILVCRDAAKSQEAARQIRQTAPQAALESISADLSSQASVRNLIDTLGGRFSKLDVLINNAAVMASQRTVTEEGLELMFQVNYLAPFMLCNGLLPLLKSSVPAQIINITLPSPKQRLDFENLQLTKRYDTFSGFFQTKLCLLLFSLELARRQTDAGLVVNCMVPGAFKSNLGRGAPPFLFWMMGLFLASAESAAEHVLALAKLADLPGQNGKIYQKRQEQTIPAYWQETAVRERLWALSEALIK